MRRNYRYIFHLIINLLAVLILLGCKCGDGDDWECPKGVDVSGGVAHISDSWHAGDCVDTGAVSVQLGVRVAMATPDDSVSIYFTDSLGNTIYLHPEGIPQPVIATRVDSVGAKASLLAPPGNPNQKWVGFQADLVISQLDTFITARRYDAHFIIRDVDSELVHTAGIFDLFYSAADSSRFLLVTGKSQQIPTLTEWGLIIFGVLLVGFMTRVIVRRRKRLTVSI